MLGLDPAELSEMTLISRFPAVEENDLRRLRRLLRLRDVLTCPTCNLHRPIFSFAFVYACPECQHLLTSRIDSKPFSVSDEAFDAQAELLDLAATHGLERGSVFSRTLTYLYRVLGPVWNVSDAPDLEELKAQHKAEYLEASTSWRAASPAQLAAAVPIALSAGKRGPARGSISDQWIVESVEWAPMREIGAKALQRQSLEALVSERRFDWRNVPSQIITYSSQASMSENVQRARSTLSVSLLDRIINSTKPYMSLSAMTSCLGTRTDRHMMWVSESNHGRRRFIDDELLAWAALVVADDGIDYAALRELRPRSNSTYARRKATREFRQQLAPMEDLAQELDVESFSDNELDRATRICFERLGFFPYRAETMIWDIAREQRRLEHLVSWDQQHAPLTQTTQATAA